MLVREDVVSRKKLEEIKRRKNEIENKLKIKLSFGENYITAEGRDSLSIITFEDFVKAVNVGFDIEDAMKIINQNHMIAEIDIERYSGKRKSHKRRISARVIGREGSAKRTIEEMTNTKIIIDDRNVYILGEPEDVSIASEAVEEILSGSKHSTAYNKIRKKARWRKLERKYELIYTI